MIKHTTITECTMVLAFFSNKTMLDCVKNTPSFYKHIFIISLIATSETICQTHQVCPNFYPVSPRGGVAMAPPSG